MSFFWLASLAGAGVVVAAAAIVRGRFFAVFSGVWLVTHGAIGAAIAPRVASALVPLFLYLHVAVYVHFFALVWARLRPLGYRLFVSLPAMFFAGGTMLALPWVIAIGWGAPAWLLVVPYAIAAFGLVQTVRTREEEIDVDLGDDVVDGVRRHVSGSRRDARPLRLVQITDPHLGPFMSVARLRGICERAVARDPDLVLLTGDFVTMESHAGAAELTEALAPLRALAGRTFACFGNHDHEAPATVRAALESARVRLLVDEADEVDTGAGPVQVLGVDYRRRGRAEHIASVTALHPRVPGAFRLVLLHDPGAFRFLPEGDADLVLSGHTHGGQLGLLSIGWPHTIVSAVAKMPDHGLWARGRDRLYVHRGTGVYGFPIRVGVPAEESLLRVHGLRRDPAGP